MADEKEYNCIAKGNSGRVYYPAISCTDLPDIDVTKYISKLTTKANAIKEKEIADKVRDKMEFAIVPEFMCSSPLIIGDKDTLLYSKFGGKDISEITINLEYFFHSGKPLPANYSVKFLEDFFQALLVLQEDVRLLNEQSIYNNDIQDENILYDETTKKAYLIDFEYSSNDSDERSDSDNMIYLIKRVRESIDKLHKKMSEGAGDRKPTRRKPTRRKPM